MSVPSNPRNAWRYSRGPWVHAEDKNRRALPFFSVIPSGSERDVSPRKRPRARRPRWRYNGLYTLAWTTGFLAGPAVGGAALGAGDGSALLVGLIAACAVSAFGAVRLRPHLPVHADIIGAAALRTTPRTAPASSAVHPDDE